MRTEEGSGRLAAIAARIDRLIAAIGRTVMWLCLFLVLIQFCVVLMRYAFAAGSIRLSESILYAHAALFLLAAAWTLQQDGHVRVDVFYSKASARTKALVDLLGALLFLLPFMAVIIFFALPYVARSWSVLERSRETSGLPFVYLLKTLVPLFALLMGLQGISQVIHAALTLSAAPSSSEAAGDPAGRGDAAS
ncbi:MAG: TRAP transporter small permease subunit [Alphaproteobacteria bacterium]|nr:MAG: TRAP transporter small permease subunit [Alphaproteobacteria bacterium]